MQKPDWDLNSVIYIEVMHVSHNTTAIPPLIRIK